MRLCILFLLAFLPLSVLAQKEPSKPKRYHPPEAKFVYTCPRCATVQTNKGTLLVNGGSAEMQWRSAQVTCQKCKLQFSAECNITNRAYGLPPMPPMPVEQRPKAVSINALLKISHGQTNALNSVYDEEFAVRCTECGKHQTLKPKDIRPWGSSSVAGGFEQERVLTFKCSACKKTFTADDVAFQPLAHAVEVK